ncbi:unnamed protein product, partial [Iphiclides podalirius]
MRQSLLCGSASSASTVAERYTRATDGQTCVQQACDFFPGVFGFRHIPPSAAVQCFHPPRCEDTHWVSSLATAARIAGRR